MKLIKFNFLTLILSALITFNVGVAGSLCTPDNDEFDDRITNQDSTDPELQVEDIPTTDEIGTTASENIASTAAETTGALEAPIMDTAVLTAEVAVEVIGVIGVAIAVGMVIYHIVTVFEDPNATTADKIASFYNWTLAFNIISDFGPSPTDREEEKLNKILKAVNGDYIYESPKAEVQDMTKFASKVHDLLISGMNNTEGLEKIYSEHGRDLFFTYRKQYFTSVQKLQALLEKVYSAQWMKGSPKFVALEEFLDHSIKGMITTPPSILSNPTLELCGINADSNHVLSFKDMNPGQIQGCLGNIFYDYKTHFSAYKLEDLITIKSPDTSSKKPPYTETDKNYPFSEFLGSYVKTYNFFLSNMKISYANAFYKQRKQGREKICRSAKDFAEKFLVKAKQQARKATEKMFRERYNLNNQGQNMNALCWDKSGYTGHNYPVYDCVVVPYHPNKDMVLINILKSIDTLPPLIDTQIEECLAGKSDDYVAFAKFLNRDPISPLLDISNTAQSFTSILLGVKSNLLFSVRKKAKAFNESNKK